jgi:hypothetical protein
MKITVKELQVALIEIDKVVGTLFRNTYADIGA